MGALVTFNPGLACGDCDACREHNEPACANFRVIGVDPSIQASFAEYITVPARNVVRLADSLRPDLGALVEPLAVGFHAARRGGCGERGSGGGDRRRPNRSGMFPGRPPARRRTHRGHRDQLVAASA